MKGPPMIRFDAILRRSFRLIWLPAFVSTAFSAPLPGSQIVLRSVSTDRHLVTWSDGASAGIHASARQADERAPIAIEAAAEGYVAIRSVHENALWRVSGEGSDARIVCAGDAAGDDASFAWVDNADGSVSLRAKSNGRYLSVTAMDTTIVPSYDSAALAGVSAVQADSLADPAGRPSLVLTPEMLRPYVVTHYVLRASAATIGDAEKFRIAPKALGKQAAASRMGKTLTYLYGISGKKTIGGIHNREPNSNPARWTNWVNSTAGKYPGLWGGDFLYSGGDISSRGTMIDQAKAQWNSGAVVTLMYHMCPPTQGESCGWNGGVQSKLTDAQWTQLVTDGSALNATFKQRLRNVGNYLKTLQDAGVEVLFRPFHEMNQGAFWWGGRTGANGTARLYRIAHDYLVGTMGLTNVSFVWSVQDLSWNFQDYDPGEGYWDVMSLDVYNGDGFTAKKYNAMLDVAGSRLIAIAETAKLPTSAELLAQPRWAYFSGWSELTQQDNSTAAIQSVYTAANTVSRDEMPGWANVISGNNVTAIAKNASSAAPEFRVDAAAREIRFDLPRSGHVTVALIDANGAREKLLFDGPMEPGSYARSFIAAGIRPGVHFAKLEVDGAAWVRKMALLD
jgi:beta-mannanase